MENSRSCFNCDLKLGESDVNFCPNCGQKVDNNNLSLKAVLVEFYENYLSFDTRLGRSIFPFLFIPGKLTKKFIDGKRMSFVNPFRFYLIISVLFFYSLGMVLNESFSRNGKKENKLSEEVKEQIDKSKQMKELNQLEQLLDSIKSDDSLKLKNLNYDSLLESNNLSESISIQVDDDSTGREKNRNGVFLKTGGSNFQIDFSDFIAVKKYRFDFDYTDAQLLDTLGVHPENTSEFKYSSFSQAMKLYRSNSKIITKFILGNFSIAMFALIPMMALILMLFYYKSKIPFVAHLIHSLQLHTFSLLIYSIALLLIYYTEIPYTPITAFLISVVYFFFSFKRVYEKKSFPSFLRLVGVGVIYYFIWGIVLGLCLLASFLLF